jgi:hypothetical protein
VFGLNPISSAALSSLTGQDRSASVFEQATASEADFVAASTFLATLSEALQAIDAAAASAAFPTAVSESTTVSDSASSAAVFSVQIVESGTAADTASAVAAFTAQIEELSTAQDLALVVPSVFNASVMTGALVFDSISPAGSIYNANVVLSAQAADFLRRAKLRAVSAEGYTSTSALVTVLTADAEVPSTGATGVIDFNLVSASVTAMSVEAITSGTSITGTVESGQITVTVLP